MITYQTVECTKCGSIQELTSKDYTSCENGCYKIKLDGDFFGYSYSTEGSKTNCIKELNDRKCYLEDRDIIIKMNDEIISLINQIKDLNKLKKTYSDPISIYEYNIKDSNGTELLESIKFQIYELKGEEATSLNLNIRFVDTIRNYSENEKIERQENVINRLNRFKILAEKILLKELDLNDRNYFDEIDDIYSEREQLKLYDVEYKI